MGVWLVLIYMLLIMLVLLSDIFDGTEFGPAPLGVIPDIRLLELSSWTTSTCLFWRTTAAYIYVWSSIRQDGTTSHCRLQKLLSWFINIDRVLFKEGQVNSLKTHVRTQWHCKRLDVWYAAGPMLFFGTLLFISCSGFSVTIPISFCILDVFSWIWHDAVSMPSQVEMLNLS